MNVKVSDIMIRQVITAEPHHTVERLRRIMTGNQLHAIPIVGPEGEVKGIVSSSDLASNIKGYTPAGHIMTERVYTIPAYNDVSQAARLMRNHGVHHVVVTQEQKIVGILSAFDLLQLFDDHCFEMKESSEATTRKQAK